jgi:hypothetical protein
VVRVTHTVEVLRDGEWVTIAHGDVFDADVGRALVVIRRVELGARSVDVARDAYGATAILHDIGYEGLPLRVTLQGAQ